MRFEIGDWRLERGLLMGKGLDELEVLGEAQRIADEVWARVISWDGLPREVVGLQLARAVDSVGANIAEAFGRFHYADKIRFLYYARGSLFETRYWLFPAPFPRPLSH